MISQPTWKLEIDKDISWFKEPTLSVIDNTKTEIDVVLSNKQEPKVQTINSYFEQVDLNEEQSSFIHSFYEYIKRIKQKEERINKIPTSMIIRQAILESWWGTSKYFEKYNNPFWIYTFNRFWKRKIRKFKTIPESIQYYWINLLSHEAYGWFQQEIQDWEQISSLELIEHLDNYSENKDYIQKLREIIISYKLTLLDYI